MCNKLFQKRNHKERCFELSLFKGEIIMNMFQLVVCLFFSSFLISWLSRMTLAFGSRRKAWWECPAKPVSNTSCEKLSLGWLLLKMVCTWCSLWSVGSGFHSALEMFQHHRDFSLSVWRTDQPAGAHTCRHWVHHWGTQTYIALVVNVYNSIKGWSLFWVFIFKVWKVKKAFKIQVSWKGGKPTFQVGCYDE